MCDIICNVCKERFQSRNKLFKHVRYAHIENDQNGDANLKLDDEIQYVPSLRTAYEDDNLLVLIKPQGMASMGVNSRLNEETVVKSTYLMLENPTDSAYKKAVAVHRLDKCTGGLVLCSKSLEVESSLRYYFRNKTSMLNINFNDKEDTIVPPEDSGDGVSKRAKFDVDGEGVYEDIGIKKKYRAIVAGLLPVSESLSMCNDGSNFSDSSGCSATSNSQVLAHLGVGYIDSPIGGKHSVTKYEVVKTTPSRSYGISDSSSNDAESKSHQASSFSDSAMGWVSTIDCYPLTGRRHQLRKHFASIGHPIIGDRLYSTANQWPDRMRTLCLSSVGADQQRLESYYLNPPFFLWAVELDIPLSLMSEHAISNTMKNPVINSKLRTAGVYGGALEGISSGVSCTYGDEYATIRLGEPDYYEIFRMQQEKNCV